jgi:hypothetical protein
MWLTGRRQQKACSWVLCRLWLLLLNEQFQHQHQQLLLLQSA